MHYFLFDNFIIIALVYSIPKYLIYRGWQNQTASTYSNTLVNGIVTIEEIALVYTLWVLSTIFFLLDQTEPVQEESCDKMDHATLQVTKSH